MKVTTDIYLSSTCFPLDKYSIAKVHSVSLSFNLSDTLKKREIRGISTYDNVVIVQGSRDEDSMRRTK